MFTAKEKIMIPVVLIYKSLRGEIILNSSLLKKLSYLLGFYQRYKALISKTTFETITKRS